MIKNVEKIDDLRFNLSDKMKDLIIEIILIKEMLKENNLNDIERESLNKKRDKLLKQFKKAFQKNNINVIKQYNEILDTK